MIVRCARILVLLVAMAIVTDAQPVAKTELYFIGIGDVPADMIESFRTHFSKKFAIDVQVLSPLAFDRVAFDAERSQMVAERLIQAVRYRHPTLVRNPRTRIIAITPLDMYIEEMKDKWQFAFSLRNDDRHLAVVSYARMDPRKLGDAPNEELLRSRLRKMITKNIGIMYFGLPGSTNPRSVMFNSVLGVEDLDRMTEEFDPK